MESLRDILRLATREPHECLDALMGPLDLTQPSGMTTFLQIQHYALQSLEQVVARSQYVAPPPLHLVELEEDLARLSAQIITTTQNDDLSSMHPLGAVYVVAGSHSGAKLMLKQWRKSTDSNVLSAGKFLSNAAQGDAWPVVRDFLKTCSFADEERNRIVQSALDCFALYQRAYTTAMSEGLELNVR